METAGKTKEDWFTDPWVGQFEEWIEMFLIRLSKKYPHIWEKSSPPALMHGIPVNPNCDYWVCKICGNGRLVKGEPYRGLPCWKAVVMFYLQEN